MRSAADAMRTHDALETEDYRRVDALTRDAEGLPAPWSASVTEQARPPSSGGGDVSAVIAGLEPLFLQAMRPFLSRCADAVMARTIFGGWSQGDLSALPAGTGLLADHALSGAPAALLPLRLALALPSARVPVLR